MKTKNSYKTLITETEALKIQLEEAERTIEAIRAGEVDAFVVNNGNQHEIFTLKSADLPYRIFIEKMSEGAVTLDREGIILYCNPSFEKMADTTLMNIPGIQFVTFFDKASAKALHKILLKPLQRECKLEADFKNANGLRIPVLLSMNGLEREGQTSLNIIITDLSSQKESQHQKRMIEKKDEFITIASHELRTPVTSIKGYLQLLKFDFVEKGNGNAVHLLNSADKQINKLSMLINDLLDVTKIEHGELKYNETNFDINELVKETIEETELLTKNHSLKYDRLPPCTITGDKNKLGQVITHFINNAVKYSPLESVITISAIAGEKAVRLSVEDCGIGIPKDQQGKIFDRFYRVTGDHENTYAGLGLGLYISDEIIKRHKGKIGVESEPGKGAAFYFELPLYKQLIA